MLLFANTIGFSDNEDNSPTHSPIPSPAKHNHTSIDSNDRDLDDELGMFMPESNGADATLPHTNSAKNLPYYNNTESSFLRTSLINVVWILTWYIVGVIFHFCPSACFIYLTVA
jgi:hypothetical protein